MKLFLLSVLLLSSPLIAKAQSSNSRPPLTGKEASESEQSLTQEMNLPPEMRARLAIERANNEHKKILEDAEKLNDLSFQVAKRYREKGKLTSDDMKNISTIEKLAKRILSFAGGSEEKSEEPGKLSLENLLNQLSEMAAKVKESLAAETRHVISAKLIANSNEAINLVQLIRKAQNSNP